MKRFFVISIFAVGLLLGSQVGFTKEAEAADIWCSNDGYYDYYVDDSTILRTASDLRYVYVDCSNGERILYCFDHLKGWKYSIVKGAHETDGFIPVSYSQLANDILYVVLQLEK